MPISSNLNEITDDKILSLLGLEDRVDIPTDEYFQLLQERIQRSAFGVDKLSAEELAILSNEKKRIRDRKDTKDKLKIKKTKITAEGLGVKKPGSFVAKAALPYAKTGVSAIIKRPNASIQSPEVLEKQSQFKPLEGALATINDTLNSILQSLSTQNKIKEKDVEIERRKRERSKREAAEAKLEKRFETLKKIASKIIAPVKGILDKIINFFVQIFLGRVVIKLLDWLADPQNASKVKSILRFIGDWWPALLGSYILFGTTFGRFIRGTVGLLSRFIFQIGKVAIPSLLKLIAKNPLASLVVGASIAGTVARTGEREKLKPELEKQRASVEKTEKDPSAPWYQKLGGFFAKQELTTGQQNQSIVAPVPGAMFSGGGLASGFVSGEKGVDKVPAMLSDGEFVMSRGAVSKFGIPFLESINAAGGGTNKPKIVSGTTYAYGGGEIVGADRSSDPSSRRNKQELRKRDRENALFNLTSGFRGETSKSDVYLVRAVNELVKVLRSKFPESESDVGSSSTYSNQPGLSKKSSGSESSGSGFGPQLGTKLGSVTDQLVSRGSQAYQGIKNATNRGVTAAKKASETASKKVQPLIQSAKKAASDAVKKSEPLMQSLPARMDYGSLYLRSQFGGLGGSITESDLSGQTQDEYKKAFQRAKADLPNRIAKTESVVRQYQGLLAGPNLTAEQKKDFNNKLANAKGELAKYKKGLVNVEYSDFVDQKGKLSPSAEAAQKTLGAVWASQTKDGGIKVEKEPYDFPLIEDPLGLIRWKQLSEKEKLAWLNKQNPTSAVRRKLDPRIGGSFSKWGKQDIAEAMYTMNPFATPVETDVKIGGKPRAKGVLDRMTNILDNPLLSMSRGLAMNLLKGKQRNVVTGEAEKGSLWDKVFPQAKKKEQLPKPGQTKGSVTMYSKPQKNTGQSYKSRFSRPKNAGVKPPKPPAKPKPKVTVVAGGGMGGARGSAAKRKPATQSTPNFSAQHGSGSFKSASAYGIYR